MAHTFKGGVHPVYSKEHTSASPILEPRPPKEVVLPMKQHLGAELTPLVKPGDYVLMGQKVADSDAFISAPVHASVSGYVRAVEPRLHPAGGYVQSVIIENDYKDAGFKGPPRREDEVDNLSPDDIVQIARESGLVGMGGAAFPTHAKLRTALDKGVSTLIVNGAECEPYITSDHRAMIEYPRQIAEGIKLIMKCLCIGSAYIAIENNKPDAIETMKSVTAKTGIFVVPLSTKYPQGGEKQLIRAIADIEVPPGKLPMDVGCAVFNVDTCASLYRAVVLRRNLVKRVITVSGPVVRDHANILARIGTPISYLFEMCGGFTRRPVKFVMGGPMMGVALATTDAPVIKGTSSLLAFGEERAKHTPMACIRCGRCVRACPMRLMPLYINQSYGRSDFDECERLNVSDCIECGCCAYVCPSRIPLVQVMKSSKYSIAAKKKKAAKH